MANTNVTIRMDTDLKRQADELFSSLGLNITTAINMFIRKAISEQGIPFEVRKGYSNEVLQAMLESERLLRDPNVKTYHTFDEILEEISQEDED
jgi:DNA-damage-inducible protein J